MNLYLVVVKMPAGLLECSFLLTGGVAFATVLAVRSCKALCCKSTGCSDVYLLDHALPTLYAKISVYSRFPSIGDGEVVVRQLNQVVALRLRKFC
jgi:hypothetical protein